MANQDKTLTPLVWDAPNLVDLIHHLLEQRVSSVTLVVCSTKDAFLEVLQSNALPAARAEEPEIAPADKNEPVPTALHPWSVPTLRLLASSRKVKVVFCSDLTHLRANLAAYAYRSPVLTEKAPINNSLHRGVPLLVLLNPIDLHRPTSAFSAQGLNRTFAMAVEAAAATGSRLVTTECGLHSNKDDPSNDTSGEYGHQLSRPDIGDPWNEEVSILNVTTKSFGVGERGWVGRKVKIRVIAERWCRFEAIGTHERSRDLR